jgi:hypothetical protein
VPFADCLNHTNVQTKYDYDVDDNGTFRLFPTGSNSYVDIMLLMLMRDVGNFVVRCGVM